VHAFSCVFLNDGWTGFLSRRSICACRVHVTCPLPFTIHDDGDTHASREGHTWVICTIHTQGWVGYGVRSFQCKSSRYSLFSRSLLTTRNSPSFHLVAQTDRQTRATVLCSSTTIAAHSHTYVHTYLDRLGQRSISLCVAVPCSPRLAAYMLD